MATIQEQTLIRNLYPRLRDLAENQFNNPVEKVYTLELETERKHRQGKPEGTHFENFTPGDAARYFTLRFVFEGQIRNYTVQSLLNVRLSALYGQAIANEYRDEIANEFKPEEIKALLALDYSEMMR